MPEATMPEPAPLEQLLTPNDVARQAQVSRDTVYREVVRGNLKALRVGRQLRFHPQHVDQWMR